jgi:hypothetical protein
MGEEDISAIDKAIKNGAPPDVARALLERLNRLIERGDWVPLHIDKPRFAIGNIFRLNQGTSIMTYWGPKEFIDSYGVPYEEVISYGGKEYHQITRNKAETLLHKCKVVKMHEIIAGSVFYPTWVCRSCNGKSILRARNIYNNSKEIEKCSICGAQIDPAQERQIESKRPSKPVAGRPLHRHWELAELYHYLSKNRMVDEFIGR